MLTQRTLLVAQNTLRVCARRNLGVSAVAVQKVVDPIQQLFLDKVREYSKKSAAAGGKMVDAGAETEANLKKELEKLARAYGGSPEEMTKFPSFSFQEPKLDPVTSQAAK